MTKSNDDVIILRPGELVEITMEMVPYEEPLVPESLKPAAHSAKDGRSKSDRSKSPKRKSARRRKA